MKIERQMPDAKWEHAADIALEVWKPWLAEHAMSRFVMQPVAAPDGSTVEYLISVRAYRDADLVHTARTLIVDDKVVQGGGVEPATAYLHRLGFPGRKLERGLLFEILESYGLIGVEWGQLPSVNGWAVLDNEGIIRKKPVVLEYDDGATLTLYRHSPEDDSRGTDAPKLVDELQFRFDRDAKITRKHSRERRDGTWTPLP